MSDDVLVTFGIYTSSRVKKVSSVHPPLISITGLDAAKGAAWPCASNFFR